MPWDRPTVPIAPLAVRDPYREGMTDAEEHKWCETLARELYPIETRVIRGNDGRWTITTSRET